MFAKPSVSLSAVSASLQPLLKSKLKLHDTCGVNNLHGMPGILGAVAGAVAASVATVQVYGYR